MNLEKDLFKINCNNAKYHEFLVKLEKDLPKKYEELVSYSDTTRKWSSNAIKNKYLFVSDNKAFKTMFKLVDGSKIDESNKDDDEMEEYLDKYKNF